MTEVNGPISQFIKDEKKKYGRRAFDFHDPDALRIHNNSLRESKEPIVPPSEEDVKKILEKQKVIMEAEGISNDRIDKVLEANKRAFTPKPGEKPFVIAPQMTSTPGNSPKQKNK